MPSRSADVHSRHSVLREIILEHQLVADLLRRLWQRGQYDVEILRSEYDAGGYDLVVVRGDLTRHVQLKAVRSGGRTRHQTLNIALAARPSGCVVCIRVDEALEVDGYLWFGDSPGHPLPDISTFPVAKHTKGNADGTKADRPAHRRVPMSHFQPLGSIDDLIDRLLGPMVHT